MSLLEWAVRYARLGWLVFPLGVKSKAPMISKADGGRGCLNATLNENQVREWWTKWPLANIGIATGHGFWALDIDVKKGGDETWDLIRTQYPKLPDTIEQTTGTLGRHLLYLPPSDFIITNTESLIGAGIDTRGRGGYIVAAPSIHPDTKRPYFWDGIEEIEQQKIAHAPGWLLTMLREALERKAAPGASESKTPPKIISGGRNSTLFKTAARARRFGWGEKEILAALVAINQERCEPPLEYTELARIAASAAKYSPNARFNLFANEPIPVDVPAPAKPEAPVTPSDVELAIEAAIKSNNMSAVVDMARDVAKLQRHTQAGILLKLHDAFKSRFSSKLFEEAMGLEPPAKPPPLYQEPREPDGTTPESSEVDIRDRYPYTDAGNAERLVATFGDQMRYCVEMTKWLIGDGKRWAVDDKRSAVQLAIKMARELYRQGHKGGENQKQMAWARKSENRDRIHACLEIASTQGDIPIRASELDRGEYWLNCENGVIDLRTGRLLPHDRGLYITKLCPVHYDPDAECKRFLGFLHWAMGQNPDADLSSQTVRMCGFIQRSLGYSLTADVSEKAVFVCYGEKGNNGKTTLLTLIRDFLDNYSAQISIDTLMMQRGSTDAGLRADLADLRGARFVITSEVNKESRMDEGKLKYISAGMGEIKSCRKYENPIEFLASHKLWMDCNHRPRVTGTDDAIWSRLKCIPFIIRMEREDPEFDLKLKEKLKAEAPGILAWAVRGCVAWLAEGLGEPPEINQAGMEWREHDDPLKDFLEDSCEVKLKDDAGDESYWVRSADLSQAYAWWCKQHSERFPLNREAFGDRIKAKAFKQSRSRRDADGKQMRTTEGLRIRDEVAKKIAGASVSDHWKGMKE
jgi:P4 family phage/plasmid primase-like protien